MHQHRRAAIAVALTGALTGAGGTAMAASPARTGPLNATAAAKAAGVSTVGGAYMGWSAHSHGRPVLTDRRAAGMRARALGAVPVPGPAGVDVSAWNGPVDWATLHSGGAQFAYIKATEGNYYTSSTFTQQYDTSQQAGLIRGAYHFANPAVSTGANQASYFVAHGGGWAPGGSTLPGVLDIEYNPYGPTCYGQSTPQMVTWITSFTDQYKKLTGRDAVIYTAADWWNQCTANTTAFNGTNPLWVARYAPTPGTLPGNWATYTFWQHTSTPNDQDWFNGPITALTDLAHGTPTPPAPVPVPRPAHLRVLHYGMNGADVQYAQQLLNLLGSDLSVDGQDGPATLAAVSAFQRQNHLAADAIVGPITWSHLQAATGQ